MMCEHCSSSEIQRTSVYEFAEEDRPALCEWPQEPSTDAEALTKAACERPPVWLLSETYVEGHLCERHAGAVSVLEEAYELLPINDSEPRSACDYEERGLASGKSAAYAKVVIAVRALCEDHSAEDGSAQKSSPDGGKANCAES